MLKRMLPSQIFKHGGPGCDTALSPGNPSQFIPEWNGQIFIHLPPFEEVNSVQLILRFRHYRYRSPA